MSLNTVHSYRNSCQTSGLSRVFRNSLVWTALLFSAALPAYSAESDDYENTNAKYFIASFNSNQLMLFNELTGSFEKIVAAIDKPVASQIGFGGDLFEPSFTTGDIYRFDGFTGEYKGIFVHGGDGGLTNPSAPDFGLGPDGLMYVGDFATNKILRFDRYGHFVDVFADETSGLIQPYMPTFDETSFYIASGGTNSVLRWDIKTKKFLGAFVKPGSGGLVHPIGMEFGPDGNLYVASNGTNAVLRYNGKTGEFMDVFVPSGTGGIDNLYTVRFGGPNSNMYVVSNNNNKVIEFDRTTGDFVRVVSDGGTSGISGARGLTFSPRPIFHVYANVAQECDVGRRGSFRHVHVERRLKDFSDSHPNVALISITSSDPNVDIRNAVDHARYGTADYDFELSFENTTGAEQHYTITYRASNNHGLTTIATTEVIVPSE